MKIVFLRAKLLGPLVLGRMREYLRVTKEEIHTKRESRVGNKKVEKPKKWKNQVKKIR